MTAACRPIDDWPTLLLGPMVRRVTPDVVSVFVATSIDCTAQLAVASGLHGFDQIQDDDFEPNPIVRLDRIGERLWVGLVQAWLPGAAFAGQTFSYDLRLDPVSAGSPKRLDDLGQLGNSTDPILEAVPLGYQRGQLPSFLVPPPDTGSLRLAHASCRKPHGGTGSEPDALRILDEVIALSLDAVDPDPPNDAPPDSNRERPHQLILTGDQIYADDVAPSLLAALMEASDGLMGWHEELPLVDNPLTDFMLSPGWRTRYLNMADIVEVPAIGDEDFSANHLLRFGEWCAMYLFAWSDALWARSTDKLGVELPATASRLPVTEVIKLANLVETLTIGQTTIPASWTKWLTLGEIVDAFSENLDEVWEATHPQAMGYGSSVRLIRRLLANVATYTMFDDHEITDDWFLNRTKTDHLLGIGLDTGSVVDLDDLDLDGGGGGVDTDDDDSDQDDDVDEDSDVDDDLGGSGGDDEEPPELGGLAELGPRLLRNGLSAYAVFQHWGNVPADFGCGDPGQPRDADALGAELLQKWVVPGNGATPPLGTDTRAAHRLLGIDVQPSILPDDPSNRSRFRRMRWDYAVAFSSHRLIALDTRTWRHFPTQAAPTPWPGNLPPAEQTPTQTMNRRYLQEAADAWDGVMAGAASNAGRSFVEIVQACVGAGSVVATAEDRLNDVADALETMLAPPFWPGDSYDLVEVEIGRFRSDFYSSTDPDRPAPTAADHLWRGGVLLQNVAAIATSVRVQPVSQALGALGDYLQNEAGGSSLALAASVSKVLTNLGTDTLLVFFEDVDATAAIALAIDRVLPLALAGLADIVPNERSEKFFRDGTAELASALISESALQFQLTDVIAADDPALARTRPTVILSPAPIFGNPLVEALQRGLLVKATLGGKAGAEEADFEAWATNGPGMNSLLVAAGGLRRCVVLSGDVHYANSSVNDVELLDLGPAPAPVRTRYVQLTSSATRNATSTTKILGTVEDMLWADDGEFKATQMIYQKLRGAPAPPDDGLSLLKWAEEVAEEWVDDTFSLENFQLFLEDQLEDIPKPPLDLIRWQIEAPINNLTSWSAEIAYLMYSLGRFVVEFGEDPHGKIFGQYVYSRDVLRQQLVDFYNAYGVDPALGHQVRRTIMRDRRTGRLDLYRARERYVEEGPDAQITRYASVQEVQTVGSNNVGLVRFVIPEDEDAVRGVTHELLWYLKAAPDLKPKELDALPAGKVVGAPARHDWMGTLHEMAWTGEAHHMPPELTGAPTGPVVG